MRRMKRMGDEVVRDGKERGGCRRKKGCESVEMGEGCWVGSVLTGRRKSCRDDEGWRVATDHGPHAARAEGRRADGDRSTEVRKGERARGREEQDEAR
jgi:hypothetical protein